ncbi:MAG: MoxR family ATPase [Planctomycetota bacterium]|nr:MoxR family ATPase [Planctomycetota bacterium]
MSDEPAKNDYLSRLRAGLESVIQGKSEAIRRLVTALLAGGHVLMEDVPGVGKTTLAKALATLIGGEFRRIQFTPDLLPADITGSAVYNPKQGEFTYRRGPIFANILLADEINRASPRTQSALLEAMSEKQVTIEGNASPLEPPFLVIATQNPVEFHGTYPLPEAQLDRFMLKLQLGYPDLDAELQMLTVQGESHPLSALSALGEIDELVELQKQVTRVTVSKAVARYIVRLVAASRNESRLKLGVSPRGSLSLYRVCQAAALLAGRDHVLPDDVKAFAVPVLAHRILIETKARYQGLSKEAFIEEVLEKTPVEM